MCNELIDSACLDFLLVGITNVVGCWQGTFAFLVCPQHDTGYSPVGHPKIQTMYKNAPANKLDRAAPIPNKGLRRHIGDGNSPIQFVCKSISLHCLVKFEYLFEFQDGQ